MRKIAVLLLGLLLLTGCADSQTQDTPIVVEEAETVGNSYTQIAVKRGTIKSEESLACQYAPKEKITCAFTGQEREITEVLVEKGDLVTEGQVLARQNVEEYEELILEEQHAIEMAQLSITQLSEMKQVDLDILERTYEFQDEEKRDEDTYRLNREKTTKQYDEQIIDYQDDITVHTLRLSEYQ